MLQATLKKLLLLSCSLFIFSGCNETDTTDANKKASHQTKKDDDKKNKKDDKKDDDKKKDNDDDKADDFVIEIEKGLIHALTNNAKANHVKSVKTFMEGKDEAAKKELLANKEEATGRTVGHFLVEASDFDLELLKTVCALEPENCTAENKAKQTPLDLLAKTNNLSVDSVQVFLDHQVSPETVLASLTAAPESAKRDEVLKTMLDKDNVVLSDKVLGNLTANKFKNFSLSLFQDLNADDNKPFLKKAFAEIEKHVVAEIKKMDEVAKFFEREDVLKLDDKDITNVKHTNADKTETKSGDYNPFEGAKGYIVAAMGAVEAVNVDKPTVEAVVAFIEEAKADFINHKALVAHLDLAAQKVLLTKGAVIEKTKQDEVVKAATDTAKAAEDKEIADKKAAEDKAAADKAAADKKAADEAEAASEAKPADGKPADAKPAVAKPADAKPATEAKPADATTPADAKSPKKTGTK